MHNQHFALLFIKDFTVIFSHYQRNNLTRKPCRLYTRLPNTMTGMSQPKTEQLSSNLKGKECPPCKHQPHRSRPTHHLLAVPKNTLPPAAPNLISAQGTEITCTSL